MKRNYFVALVGVAMAVGVCYWIVHQRKAPETGSAVLEEGTILNTLRQKRRAHPLAAEKNAGVSGWVVGAQSQQPIAGALVSLSTASGIVGSAAKPSLTAESNSEGAWSIKNISPGIYTASASASGYLAGQVKGIVVEPAAQKAGVRIVLGTGGKRVRGVVSDIGGGPIVGALVAAARVRAFMPAPAVVTRSGEQGDYQLELAPGDYKLTASNREYVPRTAWVSVKENTTHHFSLIPAAVISGKVVYKGSRAPVEGALVTATGGLGEAKDALQFSEVMGTSAKSNAEGKFVLRGLRSGAIHLRATGRGVSTVQPTVVNLNIAETLSEVVIEVDRAYSISGFIVRRGNEKEGLPGIFVYGWEKASDKNIQASAASDGNGYFEIIGVQPGRYSLAALGEGAVDKFMAQTVVVERANVDDVVLALEVGVKVSGRVEPPGPAGLRLSVDVEEGSNYLTNMFTTMTIASLTGEAGEDGRFVLSNVPGGNFVLRAHNLEGLTGSRGIAVDKTSLHDVVIELSPRASIAGEVVDSQGNLLSGLWVVATLKTRGGANFFLDQGGGKQRTSKKGAFQLQGLEPGSYELTVLNEQGQLARADKQDRERYSPWVVKLGEKEQKGGVRLVVERANHVITGTVLDSRGAPVVDAWVSAVRKQNSWGGAGAPHGGSPEAEGQESAHNEAWFAYQGKEEHPVLTNLEGRFRFENLREGHYLIRASLPTGLARARQAGVAINTDITLRLSGFIELFGTVTQDGQMVSTGILTLSGPVNRRIQVREGRYRLSRLEPGSYQIFVRTESGSASESVELEEAGKKQKNLVLNGWCALRGRVVDSENAPLGGLGMIVSGSAETSLDAESSTALLAGKGPKTDSEGYFWQKKVRCGKGMIFFFEDGPSMIVQDGLSKKDDYGVTYNPLVRKDFNVLPGSTLDLGTLRAPEKQAPDKALDP